MKAILRYLNRTADWAHDDFQQDEKDILALGTTQYSNAVQSSNQASSQAKPFDLEIQHDPNIHMEYRVSPISMEAYINDAIVLTKVERPLYHMLEFRTTETACDAPVQKAKIRFQQCQ